MVEIPVYDTRKLRLFHEDLRFDLVTVRIESVVTRRLEDIGSIGTVPGHTAVHSDLFERDPLFVICKDHGQTGGAALQRFHLHDDRYFGDSLLYRLFDLFLVCTHID